MSDIIVGGIDLSQTGLGLVAVPLDWEVDWGRIERATIGYGLRKGAPPWQQVERLDVLAKGVVRFFIDHAITHAWVESYPKGGRVFNLDMECEIGGAVKLALYREVGIVPHTAQLQTARKLILGRVPTSGKKAATHMALHSIHPGLRGWTGDELDAFVCANYGLSMIQDGCAIAAEQWSGKKS